MSRSWYSVTLTRAGWDAVRRRTFSRTVPMPAGVTAPCPGYGRPCLAMTPAGRYCHFCRRTMRLVLEQQPYRFGTLPPLDTTYRLATTPTLRDTSPIAKGGSDAG